jgi:hypothetical protein
MTGDHVPHRRGLECDSIFLGIWDFTAEHFRVHDRFTESSNSYYHVLLGSSALRVSWLVVAVCKDHSLDQSLDVDGQTMSGVWSAAVWNVNVAVEIVNVQFKPFLWHDFMRCDKCSQWNSSWVVLRLCVAVNTPCFVGLISCVSNASLSAKETRPNMCMFFTRMLSCTKLLCA